MICFLPLNEKFVAKINEREGISWYLPAIACDKLEIKSFVTSYRWSSDSVGNICLSLPQGKPGPFQSSRTVGVYTGQKKCPLGAKIWLADLGPAWPRLGGVTYWSNVSPLETVLIFETNLENANISFRKVFVVKAARASTFELILKVAPEG